MEPRPMSTQTLKNLKHNTLELLQKYHQSPSESLRNQLVQLNLGLVRKEVYHWLKQCGESYDDLLQVGCIGLIRAIERFDILKGHAFSSFAIPYIRGEIQHYLRDKTLILRIPRQWLTLERKAVKVIQNLQSNLQRSPTDEEVATALEISLQQWNDVKLASQNRSLMSLDAPIQDYDEGSACLGDLVLDNRYSTSHVNQEERMCLQQALTQLEDNTRQVVECVFLQDLTQKETAQRMGISTVTVSRRVKKGLSLLKEIFAEMEPEKQVG
jgi:RNA polymerase sigma-B factor